MEGVLRRLCEHGIRTRVQFAARINGREVNSQRRTCKHAHPRVCVGHIVRRVEEDAVPRVCGRRVDDVIYARGAVGGGRCGRPGVAVGPARAHGAAVSAVSDGYYERSCRTT
jgi:hypothetical protein